jgi:hypothetical protein
MARFGVAAFQNMIDIAVPAEVCASPNWGVGIHGVRCPRRWLGGSHVWARTTASPQAPEAIITASSRAACGRGLCRPSTRRVMEAALPRYCSDDVSRARLSKAWRRCGRLSH